MRRALLFALALLFAACGDADERLAAEGPEGLAALAVTVEAPAEDDTLNVARSVFYSDKAGAFFYDALAAPQDDLAMGFIAGNFRMLDGWRWWMDQDSVALGPVDRARGVARPDFAVRTYVQRDTSGFLGRLVNSIRGANRTRITERITMLDERGALLVEVPDSIGTVAFRPVFGDRGGASDYQMEARGATLLIARGNFLEARENNPRPVWLAIRATRGEAHTGARDEEPEAGRRLALGLGEVAFPTPGALVVTTGNTPEEADSLAQLALRNAERLAEARSTRMARQLDAAPFDTEDEAFDQALAWGRLTLDALTLADTSATVVVPGLPGAEPPPGRSALAVMDALLATGEWDTARSLLTTFGDEQLFDERIDILGRAPNIVRPGGRADFTSADATPLYLATVGDYVRATGDRGLISGAPNFWFKTVFAMRGLYQDSRRYGRQVSDEGFLLARDNQTWMQSPITREGIATPRGGLPVEGQGALYEALRSMTEFARIMGVSQRESARWYADSADVLLRRFPERFVSGETVTDVIDRRGQRSTLLRPSAFVALDRLELPAEQKARLARTLAEQLAYPWGLATRPQSDSLFYPFLQAPAYYSPDEAAFNGLVWTWLSGPLISVMAETGAAAKAYELLEAEAGIVLNQGVVGAIPDVVDAHPRVADTLPRVGGAPVQPWSLAAFIANAYEDLFGLHYAGSAEAVLEPHLPAAWGETTSRVRLGDGYVGVTMEQGSGALDVTLSPEGALPEDAVVRVRAFGTDIAVPVTRMQGDTLVVAAEPVTVEVTPDGATLGGEIAETTRYDAPDPAWWDGFDWVQPDLRSEYPVMRQVQAQRRLTSDQLLRDNPLAQPILSQTDPDGDDWGATSTYTYPMGIPARVLDATYFEVAEDDSTTYFRAEFVDLATSEATGFQPTFAAIAIDTEEGGARDVGRNARYSFPNRRGYEFVIFLGDGLIVEDGNGRVVGEVAPGQGSVFDPASGSLAFALPRFILPDVPRGATVTLLVGARATGGGVGTFRSVAEGAATTETGGGRVDSRTPNVYDVVTASASR
ncbi:MAG: hypothetical protein HKN04_12600 [Rhodothermaceae bacterium]|nr:hypothetical protein [Rhodothermaceae bacterium]